MFVHPGHPAGEFFAGFFYGGEEFHTIAGERRADNESFRFEGFGDISEELAADTHQTRRTLARSAENASEKEIAPTSATAPMAGSMSRLQPSEIRARSPASRYVTGL